MRAFGVETGYRVALAEDIERVRLSPMVPPRAGSHGKLLESIPVGSGMTDGMNPFFRQSPLCVITGYRRPTPGRPNLTIGNLRSALPEE